MKENVSFYLVVCTIRFKSYIKILLNEGEWHVNLVFRIGQTINGSRCWGCQANILPHFMIDLALDMRMLFMLMADLIHCGCLFTCYGIIGLTSFMAPAVDMIQNDKADCDNDKNLPFFSKRHVF